MRILILGASGGCGRWAVRLAAERGDDVTAFVRPETAYEPPEGVIVRRGSALEAADVAAAVDGQDVVLSCLGPKRTNPLNPFAPLEPPPRFAERSALVITAALAGTSVRRVGAISAAGVADSAPALPYAMHLLLRYSTVGDMYSDLAEMEEVYRASELDWFAVRPVTLVDVQPSVPVRILEHFRMHSVIARAHVARWMLDAVTSEAPLPERTPIIGWW